MCAWFDVWFLVEWLKSVGSVHSSVLACAVGDGFRDELDCDFGSLGSSCYVVSSVKDVMGKP